MCSLQWAYSLLAKQSEVKYEWQKLLFRFTNAEAMCGEKKWEEEAAEKLRRAQNWCKCMPWNSWCCSASAAIHEFHHFYFLVRMVSNVSHFCHFYDFPPLFFHISVHFSRHYGSYKRIFGFLCTYEKCAFKQGTLLDIMLYYEQ